MDYKRGSALSRDLFCVTMRLFIQKLFRVEKYHQKGNRCEGIVCNLPRDLVTNLPTYAATGLRKPQTPTPSPQY